MNIEQIRADFEAWTGYSEEALSRNTGDGYCIKGVDNEWRAYQAGRASLQSQDREDSGKLQEAARDMFVRASEIEVLYGTNKETEGLVMAAIRLAYLVSSTEKTIDHARRI